MTGPDAPRLIETRNALRDGRISAEELTRDALERARSEQERLNAFVEIEEESALASARRIDERRSRGEACGPLAGVPLAHKDMFDRKGLVTGRGSPRFADRIAPDDAAVMARLDAAGQVNLGRLNLSEFAIGPTGYNVHHGRARNPIEPARIAGGSSSGSGSSVGAGIVFAALGSDTGGSVRIPAACCGIVGLKPTQGLVPSAGSMPLSSSLDCIGPLARSVSDAELVLSVISGREPAAGEGDLEPGAGGSPFTVAVPEGGLFCEGLDEAVASHWENAIAALEKAGCRIKRVTLPPLEDVVELANVIAMCEGAGVHLDGLRLDPDRYGEQVRARLMQGLAVPAPVYLRALKLRGLATRDFVETLFTDVDALLVPTMPTLAPISEDVEVGASEAMTKVLLSLSKFTRPASFFGLPALVVPEQGEVGALRSSMQLIGAPFQEAKLCRIGRILEAADG